MFTRATLPYSLPPPDGSPAYKNANDKNDRNYIRHDVVVDIENIRNKEENYILDKAGFQFYKHVSKHTAFDNDEDVRQGYYAESAGLYKKLTGAFKVYIFDHSVYLCKYLRGMTPDEIILFKCFDSTKDKNIATFNAHSAFEDLTTPEGSPLRESIELRAMLFFE